MWFIRNAIFLIYGYEVECTGIYANYSWQQPSPVFVSADFLHESHSNHRLFETLRFLQVTVPLPDTKSFRVFFCLVCWSLFFLYAGLELLCAASTRGFALSSVTPLPRIFFSCQIFRIPFTPRSVLQAISESMLHFFTSAAFIR